MNRDSFRAWRQRVRCWWNRRGASQAVVHRESLDRAIEYVAALRDAARDAEYPRMTEAADQALRWIADALGEPLTERDALVTLRRSSR